MQNKNKKSHLKLSLEILCKFVFISYLNINFHIKFPSEFLDLLALCSFATHFTRREYSPLVGSLLITIFIIRQSGVRFPLTIYILLGIQYVSREGIINLCGRPSCHLLMHPSTPRRLEFPAENRSMAPSNKAHVTQCCSDF